MKEQKKGSSGAAKATNSALAPRAKDGVFLLRLAADGATNREISEQLGCSERTVKRRMEQVALRLGARNRTQAVAIAIREGLI